MLGKCILLSDQVGTDVQMPQRDILQRALHTAKTNPTAAAASNSRIAVPLRALHASKINLVSAPSASAHSGGSSQDLLGSATSSIQDAPGPRPVRKHRRSSLGPGRYDEAPLVQEQCHQLPDRRYGSSMLAAAHKVHMILVKFWPA